MVSQGVMPSFSSFRMVEESAADSRHTDEERNGDATSERETGTCGVFRL
jgi:hypothetical protein